MPLSASAKLGVTGAICVSVLTEPYQFGVTGAASASTTSRLTTNTLAYDSLFQLPAEAFSVQYTSASPRTVPADFEAAVYTKGTLP